MRRGFDLIIHNHRSGQNNLQSLNQSQLTNGNRAASCAQVLLRAPQCRRNGKQVTAGFLLATLRRRRSATRPALANQPREGVSDARKR
jgi:hypothetical protein